MLVAVFILFIGIVGLVLYLVVQSYSRARSEQYDASSLVEEYANNRMITQQGDVVFCYRLLLPPAYSYTAEAYDQIVEIWRVALKDLRGVRSSCAATVMTGRTSMRRVCRRRPISSARKRHMPGRA